MTNTIRTYKDLEEEKLKLQALLKAQRELIREDIADLKAELRPMGEALSFIGKVTTKDRSNFLLTEGADRIIDLVVKKIVLGRAGWVTKAVVPFLMKNYSSHVIADNKDSIIDAVKSFFTKKKKKNGKEAPESPEPEPVAPEAEAS